MQVLSQTYSGTKREREEILRAISTVIVYTMTDVFDLAEEESMWATYHIQQALAPLAHLKPHSIASPVKYEIETGAYSQRLNRHTKASPRRADETVASADLVDWATVLSDVATQCYEMRPLLSSAFVGQMSGILRELGVGDRANPRASRYLPNAVRFALAASK